MIDKKDIRELQNELNRKEITLQSTVSDNKRFAQESKEILDSFTEEDAVALQSVGLNLAVLKSLDLERLALDEEYHKGFIQISTQMKQAIKGFIDRGLEESESKF